MTTETLDALCTELDEYCTLHGLPHMSADEITPNTTAQRLWLVDFCARWDAAIDATPLDGDEPTEPWADAPTSGRL